MPYIPVELPLTPNPSNDSPSKRNSVVELEKLGVDSSKSRMFENPEQPVAGSSTRSTPYSAPGRDLPPTPPEHDIDTALEPNKSSSALSFAEPDMPQRPRRGRRPASAYPMPGDQPVYQPQRKYTDPTPRKHATAEEEEQAGSPQHFYVDLDAYSITDFDGEDACLDTREPTLSFVTTSTAESVTSTPSMGVSSFGYRAEAVDGKLEQEPRIRMRTTTGRTNAYSSAESSMASGGFSYHAYPENQVYHPHPPPLPPVPNAFAPAAEHVGLGIMADDFVLPSRQRDSSIGESSSRPPLSPSTSFAHRPWRRDVVNRLRSNSASSSVTTASASTSDTAPSVRGLSIMDVAVSYPYGAYPYANRQPWDQEQPAGTRSEAVAMVDEGRGKILDMEKLLEMGGLEALTEDVIGSLHGITHLLLPGCGSDIVPILPSLLITLAPTLVVLDLSSNDLTFLPAGLRECTALEELNVSRNPLRQLPSWIGALVALRVLVVDGCRLQGLAPEIAQLSSLHTLCARRNRLVSLPSWLCLLGLLETLRIDDNPFTPEWLPIVASILAIPPRGSSSAPAIPARSASQKEPRGHSLRSAASTASMTSSRTGSSMQSREFAPSPSTGSLMGDVGVMTPASSTNHSLYQLSGLRAIAEDHPHQGTFHESRERFSESPQPHSESVVQTPDMTPPIHSPSEPHVFRRKPSEGTLPDQEPDIPRPAGASSVTARSSNGGMAKSGDTEASTLKPPVASRTASLGSDDGRRTASAMSNHAEETDDLSPMQSSRLIAPGLVPSASNKTGKWGFLRKMSMNKLKPDKGSGLTASASSNLRSMPHPLNHANSDPVPSIPFRPGMSSAKSAMTLPTRRVFGAEPSEFGQTMVKMPSTGSTLPAHGPPSRYSLSNGNGTLTSRGKRRSFLPIDGPPSINISIPTVSPLMPPAAMFGSREQLPPASSEETINDLTMTASSSRPIVESPSSVMDLEAYHATGLESIKSYLRDLFDLSRSPIEAYGGFEVVGPDGSRPASSPSSMHPGSPASYETAGLVPGSRGSRRPKLDAQVPLHEPNDSATGSGRSSMAESAESPASGKKTKDDRIKRYKVIKEIYDTERTYVRVLGELVSIYVKPAAEPLSKGSNETLVPAAERKIVFGGIESILTIHRDNLLPALKRSIAPLLEGTDDDEGRLSAKTARDVGQVFRTYVAYMKQYSTYINNFDNALSRMKTWNESPSSAVSPAFSSKPASPNFASMSSVALNIGLGAVPTMMPVNEGASSSGTQMTAAQKKRVKTFLKRCKQDARHSQINLESYLLLPIQRVPRYKLLLEDLNVCTPPGADGPRDILDDALTEISGLASLMNEEKRDAESRLRLLHWQQRISGRRPSPLVQAHRRLILDGALNLIRLVKKASTYVEVETTTSVDPEHTITPSKIVVPVEYLAPEPMDRPMMLILCTDLLVLVQQQQHVEGWDGQVDLFNVLRMATVAEPASIVNGNVLRVVDNKSIYYFNGGSPESSTQWCRAINAVRRR